MVPRQHVLENVGTHIYIYRKARARLIFRSTASGAVLKSMRSDSIIRHLALPCKWSHESVQPRGIQSKHHTGGGRSRSQEQWVPQWEEGTAQLFTADSSSSFSPLLSVRLTETQETSTLKTDTNLHHTPLTFLSLMTYRQNLSLLLFSLIKASSSFTNLPWPITFYPRSHNHAPSTVNCIYTVPQRVPYKALHLK